VGRDHTAPSICKLIRRSLSSGEGCVLPKKRIGPGSELPISAATDRTEPSSDGELRCSASSSRRTRSWLRTADQGANSGGDNVRVCGSEPIRPRLKDPADDQVELCENNSSRPVLSGASETVGTGT
jgi:hypothetical protein